MEPTGIVRDPVYLLHEMGSYHPESPRRLEAIYSELDEIGPELNLKAISVRNASIEEISSNHSPRYVEAIYSTRARGHTYLDPDTSTCAHSWDAASKAVGGLLNLVDAVVAGEVRNGFALVRPPGHHAEWDRAMGFCLFNNIALAARYAISRHGMERVAIVDWDLHHGNGTQRSFYEDARVLFMSTHQFPYYPGTGSLRDTGHGAGVGYTVNIPFGPGAGDQEYVAAFQLVVMPLLEAFKPRLILVSAGFDAHHRDPLGGMSLTDQGYEYMMRILMDAAARNCSGKVILTLEGGYDLTALSESVRRVVTCLATYEPDSGVPMPTPSLGSLHPRAAKVIEEVLSTQRNYWPALGVV